MTRTDLLWILILTTAFEAFTCLLRFGLGLKATHHLAPLHKRTLNLRIHHSYVGAALTLFALTFPSADPLAPWTLRLGIALLASDLIHHFLILWPITGRHEFHRTHRPRE